MLLVPTESQGEENVPDIEMLEVAEVDTSVADIKRQAKLAPFVRVLQDSWDKETAMGVTFSDENAKHAVARFRSAAGAMGLGVTVVEKSLGDGRTQIIVQAKEKRQYNARTEPAPTAAKKARKKGRKAA